MPDYAAIALRTLLVAGSEDKRVPLEGCMEICGGSTSCRIGFGGEGALAMRGGSGSGGEVDRRVCERDAEGSCVNGGE